MAAGDRCVIVIARMSYPFEPPVFPVPHREFRCACGFGAVRRSTPPRCPMCGGTEWEELGWKPFAELPYDFVVRFRSVAPDAADKPLRREAAEIGSARSLPAGAFT